MKKEPPIKKLQKLIEEIAGSYAVLIGIAVFCVSTAIVILITFFHHDYSNPKVDFWGNFLVEAHGMLLDILVFGVLILCLNKLMENRMENRRYIDEIDDFRGWEDKEAAYRIAGNLRRLKRNGYKGHIDLKHCYLAGLNLRKDGILEYFSKYLSGINLTGAILFMVTLPGASLDFADLQDAKLLGADLEGANLLRANLSNADLRRVHLPHALLFETTLQNANLQNARLWNADLQDAWLLDADLQEADLRGVKNLSLGQLSVVKSLYKVKLDPELMKQVKEKCRHLLEEPVKYQVIVEDPKGERS